MHRRLAPNHIALFQGVELAREAENIKARAVPSLAIAILVPNANASSFPLNHLTTILVITTILVSAPNPNRKKPNVIIFNEGLYCVRNELNK
jgi:hypothetical protein